MDAGLGDVAVRGDVLEGAEALLHARHPLAVRPARGSDGTGQKLENFTDSAILYASIMQLENILSFWLHQSVSLMQRT